MLEYVLLFFVFAGVSGLTLTGLLLFLRQREILEQRLGSATEEDADFGSERPMLLGDLTPAFAAQIPVTSSDRTELQRELRQAGFYRPTAVMEYVALRTVLIFVPLLAAGVVALFTEAVDQAAWIWGSAALLSMLGYSLPRVYLYFRGKARMQKIERGLPVAIDMLTLCLTGGLNVLTSLQRVVKELHLAHPVLAYELEIVRQQAELRSLEFALTQFADRVGLPHLRNLLVILSQSENLGTDAVSTLREYADDMRIHMRQRADEMANKAPFKLLFPAYLLAFGAGILLISPTVLEFTAFRRQNMVGDTIHQARQVLQEPVVPTAGSPEGMP